MTSTYNTSASTHLARGAYRARLLRYASRNNAGKLFKLSLFAAAMLMAIHTTPSRAIEVPPSEPVPPNHPPPAFVPVPSPAIPSSKVTLLGFTLFKGDLHNHPRGHGDSGVPAPRRSAQSVFQMARATGGDFLAITNHDLSASDGAGCSGGEIPADPFPHLTLYECWKLTPWNSGWFNDIDTIDANSAVPGNTDGNFVPIVGYERTGKQWNHLGVLNMVEWIHDGSFIPGMEGDVNGNIQGVVNRINEGKDPILTINHPTVLDWNSLALVPTMASKTHMLEINAPDLDELNAYPLESLSPTNLAGFKQALANGWKVSPVSNSDMHSYYGTHDFTGNFQSFSNRTGIALAAGVPLTRDNLFAAMRQKRTFASSSPYLSAMMLGRGLPMGQTVSGTSPLPFNVEALFYKPGGAAQADARNICNIELWSSGNNRALRTFSFNQPSVSMSFWVNTPFFKDYFFRVNARNDCANGGERWTSLITAPIFTSSQLPKPAVTTPIGDITVIKGNSFTVNWSNSAGIPQVKLQVYQYYSGAPYGSPLVASNGGQMTWSTANWSTGAYYVGVSDPDYPGFEWTSKRITVSNPPPPPPPSPCSVRGTRADRTSCQ